MHFKFNFETLLRLKFFHCVALFRPGQRINEASRSPFSEPGRFKLKPEMSKTTFASLRTWLLDNLLLVITFSGVFIGVITGILLKPMELDKVTISYVAYPGELFMRLLKLMILPLIIASLITGKKASFSALQLRLSL